jgi:hypothetical protein
MLFFQCPWLPEFLITAADYKFLDEAFKNGKVAPRTPGAVTDEDIERRAAPFVLPSDAPLIWLHNINVVACGAVPPWCMHAHGLLGLQLNILRCFSLGFCGMRRYKQGFARPGAATATLNYYRSFIDYETRRVFALAPAPCSPGGALWRGRTDPHMLE